MAYKVREKCDMKMKLVCSEGVAEMGRDRGQTWYKNGL